MKELVFALQFKGKAQPVEGVERKLAARTTAGSQVLRTTLTAKGIQAKSESRPGPRATFESEVQITGEGTFVEAGRISYGKAGRVTFKTGVPPPTGVDPKTGQLDPEVPQDDVEDYTEVEIPDADQLEDRYRAQEEAIRRGESLRPPMPRASGKPVSCGPPDTSGRTPGAASTSGPVFRKHVDRPLKTFDGATLPPEPTSRPTRVNSSAGSAGEVRVLGASGATDCHWWQRAIWPTTAPAEGAVPVNQSSRNGPPRRLGTLSRRRLTQSVGSTFGLFAFRAFTGVPVWASPSVIGRLEPVGSRSNSFDVQTYAVDTGQRGHIQRLPVLIAPSEIVWLFGSFDRAEMFVVGGEDPNTARASHV